MYKLKQTALDKIVEQTASKKNIYGAVFHVESLDRSLSLTSASGNMQPDGQYYIASINKMFLAAITLRLCREHKLNLSDKIANYFPPDVIEGLHVYQGKDYSNEITIAHLVTQTSGLPCYLIDKRPEGPKVMDMLLQGNDQEWPVDRMIRQVKTMKPKSWPGQKGKANYTNTNIKLLGVILEVVMGKPLDSILTSLFQELGMKDTYVIKPGEERTYAPVYVKENPVRLPRYFASSYDIVSTAQDNMIFLRSFFSDHFYPKDSLIDPKQWNNIFFPFKYGMGMQKFYIPRILSPFKPFPEMIGHSGSTGTVAFYVPQKEIFITGAINQAKSPNLAFQAMVKIVNQL